MYGFKEKASGGMYLIVPAPLLRVDVEVSTNLERPKSVIWMNKRGEWREKKGNRGRKKTQAEKWKEE